MIMSDREKASFRDILRQSFPVDMDSLLEESESGASEVDTVSLETTVSCENTVVPQNTVLSEDTVFSQTTVSPETTVFPQTTVPDRSPKTREVEIVSNFFRMDGDVFDVLAEGQTPYEQLVYLFLYRYSYGQRSQTCFMGFKTIMDRCQMSKSSVRRTLDSLEQKGHIKILKRLNELGQKGTLYRVFLPCEIADLQSSTTFVATD